MGSTATHIAGTWSTITTPAHSLNSSHLDTIIETRVQMRDDVVTSVMGVLVGIRHTSGEAHVDLLIRDPWNPAAQGVTVSVDPDTEVSHFNPER